jgi:hypothetical protein
MLIRARRFGLSALAALAVALMASPAAAQDAAPVVVVTGGLDFVNQYNFRGIRQNTEGVSVWPFVDFGFTPFRGDGSLKTVTFNVGTWNAIHSQINDGNKLYETDFYGTLGLGFSKGALAFTYTSYTSPADLFAHVKELAVKASFDDSAALGRGALKPYALVAFEMDNQADAGDSTGTYVELGVAPGYSWPKVSLAIPVKVGLSGSDYYEFATGTDSKFGFFSAGAMLTVPLGSHANIHFGGEFQAFGDNVADYNGQDTAGIGTIGLGFAF